MTDLPSDIDHVFITRADMLWNVFWAINLRQDSALDIDRMVTSHAVWHVMRPLILCGRTDGLIAGQAHKYSTVGRRCGKGLMARITWLPVVFGMQGRGRTSVRDHRHECCPAFFGRSIGWKCIVMFKDKYLTTTSVVKTQKFWKILINALNVAQTRMLLNSSPFLTVPLKAPPTISPTGRTESPRGECEGVSHCGGMWPRTSAWML